MSKTKLQNTQRFRYHGDVMEMVRLHSMDDFRSLPLTKWNIKQPSVQEEREDAIETGGLDLVVAPGVAFTSKGGRLGHGKGYYDSFLNKLKETQERKASVVGLAFKEQIVDEVPLHEHDVLLDAVLYEN